MISRRDAVKLGAAGLVVPFLTSLENVTEANSVQAAQERPGTVETFGGNSARTGESPGPGPRVDLPIVRKWRVDGSDLYQKSWQMPLVVNGVAYVGDGSLKAVNADTGKILWSFYPGKALYEPTYADGVLYINAGDSHLYAVNAESGDEIWHFEMVRRSESAPAVVDNVVYCGGGTHDGFSGGEGYLYAINGTSGEELWHITTGEPKNLGTPAVVDGVVYASDYSYTYAFDANTGDLIWRFEGGGNTPAVADNLVYIRSRFRLHAIDMITGEEVWRSPETPYSLCQPSASNGLVFFGQEDAVIAFDTNTGTQRWRFSASGDFDSKITIANGVLYANTRHSQLFAIDASTGAGIWHIRYAGNGSAAVVDEKVYVGTDALVMIGNFSPTKLAEDVILRASPSNSGLERGQAAAGTEVTSLGSREDRGETVWVEATIGDIVGWIPLDSIEPDTLPPDGEIIHAEFF